MFNWTALVLLCCVTVSAIVDSKNVIDGCGKDNPKLCEFDRCHMVHVRSDDVRRFIELRHIRASPTAAYKTRLVLFVRGASHCHIVLSAAGRLNGENDVFYDFVIGEGNNDKTVIRKQRRTVISQQTNNVLSPDEPIEIRIEISSHGDISIYREGRIIVQAFDQNPLDVNYVSLGTLDPNAMDYYYNCRANDDDSDALIEPKGDLIAFAGVHHSQSNSLTPTHRLLLTHVLLCLVFLWRKT